MPKFSWNDAADARLMALYPTTPAKRLARIMGCSPDAIRHRARTLGMTLKHVPRPWTVADDLIVRDFYAGTHTAELAARLGRTTLAVERRASTLGVHKPLPAVRAQIAEVLDADADGEDEAYYTEEQLAPGHRRICFGRLAPHSHALQPRHLPSGRSSLERI